MPTTTDHRPTVAPVPTWTAIEKLPDGRTRVLAQRLRYTEVLSWRPSGQTWAVSWRQDPS